jgi:hypothetical protein
VAGAAFDLDVEDFFLNAEALVLEVEDPFLNGAASDWNGLQFLRNVQDLVRNVEDFLLNVVDFLLVDADFVLKLEDKVLAAPEKVLKVPVRRGFAYEPPFGADFVISPPTLWAARFCAGGGTPLAAPRPHDDPTRPEGVAPGAPGEGDAVERPT